MTQLPTEVFHVQRQEDLGAPLQAFLEQHASRGAPCTLRVKLAPLVFEAQHLTLDDVFNRVSPIILILEGEGGVATLRRSTLKLRAGRVLLRNLVLQEPASEGPVLQLAFGQQLLAQQVALVDARRLDASSGDPLVSLRVEYGSASARAAFKGCWFIGGQAEGPAALLEAPRGGRGALEALTLEGCVFAENRVTVGIEPWFTQRVEVQRTLALEPHLRGPFLHIQSPVPHVTLDGAAIAAAAPLGFTPNADVPRHAMPPARATGSLLLAQRPLTDAEVEATASTLRAGAPPAVPDGLRERALQGEAPDIDALRASAGLA